MPSTFLSVLRPYDRLAYGSHTFSKSSMKIIRCLQVNHSKRFTLLLPYLLDGSFCEVGKELFLQVGNAIEFDGVPEKYVDEKATSW